MLYSATPIKLLMCAAVAFFATTDANAAEPQVISWLKSAEQAALQAEKTGKPILIYVRSATCHYCDKLQNDVWADPQAAEYVQRNYIPLKLSKELNPASVQSLKVKGYPTTLVFSAKREFVGKVEGYLPPAAFFAEITKNQTAARPATQR